MRVLGCDPSISEYGWAVVDLDVDGTAELVACGILKTSSDELDALRYRQLKQAVARLFGEWTDSVDCVSVEQPPPQASYSAGLWPLWIFTSLACIDHRLDQFNFTPSTLKKNIRHWLGQKGRMRKKHSRAAARVVLDLPEDSEMNHNVADAVMAARAGGRLAQLIRGEIADSDLAEHEKDFLVEHRRTRKGKLKLKGMVFKEDDRYRLHTSPKYDHLYEDDRYRLGMSATYEKLHED